MNHQSATSILSLVIALSLVTAAPAAAQVQPVIGDCGFPGAPACTGAENVGYLVAFIEQFITLALALIGTLAVIFLVYAGVKYISSGGSEEDAATAKRQILYAVIGIVVALGAYTIKDAVFTQQANLIENLVAPFITMALVLIGTAAVVYLIYAGYKYINSLGAEESAAAAKRQIAYALLGVIVALGAYAAIDAVIGRAPPPTRQRPIPSFAANAGALVDIIAPLITMALALVGTVATIFLVYAGYKYIASQGNEEEAATAKRQIAYALIGVIVALGATTILSAFIIPGGQPFLFTAQRAADATPIQNMLVTLRLMAVTLASVVAGIFLVYGGYKYISSAGDEEESNKAKRQIAYAVLGLLVIGTFQLIVNLATFPGTISAMLLYAQIHSIVNAFLLLTAIAAGVFLIYGGIKYFSSQGDEDAARTAKNQITYAIIGIAVIMLSAAIVNFVLAALS